MIAVLLVILVLLWFLGYVRLDALPIPDLQLFVINGQPITLWNILIFLVIAGLVGILPSPLRQIAGVFLILWVLSILGILAIAGLSSLLVLAIIVGLIAYLLGLF
jgi:hypothetical protein